VFACLRPDTRHVEAILEALQMSSHAVICYAPGFAPSRLHGFASPHMRFSTRPVDLAHLAADADACVSYGAEGTVATFLLAGVPQLISPWHVEAHMAARRIESIGAAIVLRGAQDPQSVAQALAQICADGQMKQSALAFSSRYRKLDFDLIAQGVADIVEAAPEAGLASREGASSCA